ncbi:MAG: hypothetical protein R2702_00340 [Acidimicrobiales bacterium]
MAKDRNVRRLLLAIGGALLLVGAAAPSGCQPATKPMSTLHGKVTHTSVPQPLAEPPCPPGDAGGYPIEGVRQKWGFRIAAADPTEWLSLRPCLTFASGALTSIGDTTFTIYTESGEVTGTAAGVKESIGFDLDVFSVELTVTSGSAAYREASGPLYLRGCMRGTFVISGRLSATDGSPAEWSHQCDPFIGT